MDEQMMRETLGEQEPESFEELTFEEFYDLYAQADCARELIIDEIRAGVAQGIADNFTDE